MNNNKSSLFSDPRLKARPTSRTTTTTNHHHHHHLTHHQNTINDPQIKSIKIKKIVISTSKSKPNTPIPSSSSLQQQHKPRQTNPAQRSAPLSIPPQPSSASSPKTNISPSVSKINSTSSSNLSSKESTAVSSTTLKRPRKALPPPVQIKKARWVGPTAKVTSKIPTSSQTSSTLNSSPSHDGTPNIQLEKKFPLNSNKIDRRVFDSDSSESESDEKRERKKIIGKGDRSVSRSVLRDQNRGYSAVCSGLEPKLPRGIVTQSSKVVAAIRKRYKTWFIGGVTEAKDPMVQVVYPTGKKESFLLLVPKDPEDEYRPIDDLTNVIITILSHFLTPEQSLRYFSERHPISTSISISKPTDYRFLTEPTQCSSRSSPVMGEEPSKASMKTTSRTELKEEFKLSEEEYALSSKPLIKSLERAFRRQNGTEFVRLIEWYNRVMEHLISRGEIAQRIAKMDGLKNGIWETIIGQAYDRQVAPELELLGGYETWSSNVYGELRPRFVSELIRLVDLKPGQVFVDLGSGVGNIVIQVALEVGCVAVGFENMAGCCKLARQQTSEVVGRSESYWGVSHGQPVLIEADFTTDSRVEAWLKKADVVLVNNQVFTPTLNESLTLLFLELRDSTKIISLKPFITKDYKINSRNFNSPLSILKFEGVYRYSNGFVSWTDNPGEFFLQSVDRSQLIEFSSRK